MDYTKIYDGQELKDAYAKAILKEVFLILKERGYNPINQIVGYLISGDPGYISSHKEARSKMSDKEKDKMMKILEASFDEFFK